LLDEDQEKSLGHLTKHGPVHHHRGCPGSRGHRQRFYLQPRQQCDDEHQHHCRRCRCEGRGRGKQFPLCRLHLHQERRGEPDYLHAVQLPGGLRRHEHRHRFTPRLRGSLQHNVRRACHLGCRRARRRARSEHSPDVRDQQLCASTGRTDVFRPQRSALFRRYLADVLGRGSVRHSQRALRLGLSPGRGRFPVGGSI